jgi:hypothetical protein
VAGLLGLIACSDTSAPGGGGDNRDAALFDGIADSIGASGDGWRADALHHVAELVRLIGDPTTVTLTIGGQSRQFHAVAEELDVPLMVCSWPGDSGVVPPTGGGGGTGGGGTSGGGTTGGGTGGGGAYDDPPPPMPPDSVGSVGGDPGSGTCEPQGSYRMRTLIAWEPERMSEVVRLVADLGSGQVEPTVPDPMASPAFGGTPDGAVPPVPGDSTVTSPPGEPGPGFMGEYLVRDEGIWWSVNGSQENTLEHEGGACLQERATFDWAEFRCEAIQLHFRFTMTVQRFEVLPMEGWNPRDSVVPAPTPESKVITMEPASVAGARLTVLRWTMPPMPVDSAPMPPPPGPPVPTPMPQPAAR